MIKTRSSLEIFLKHILTYNNIYILVIIIMFCISHGLFMANKNHEYCLTHRYTNNTPRSDIFFSGSPTLPSLVKRLYTQV